MMEKEIEERIDRFVENEMSLAERDSFCREMETDKKLKEQVVLRKLLVEAELVKAEKRAREAMENTRTATSLKRRYTAIIAAALLIGVLFGVGNGHRYTPNEVYRTCYAEPMIESSRSGNGLSGTDAQTSHQIIRHYQQKEYRKVIALFDEHWSNRNFDQLPVASLLYVTVSFLNCNRAAEAIPILSTPQLLASEYAEEVEWLLLCAYLQENEREKAETIAHRIVDGGGQYVDKATKIMTKLEEKRWF